MNTNKTITAWVVDTVSATVLVHSYECKDCTGDNVLGADLSNANYPKLACLSLAKGLLDRLPSHHYAYLNHTAISPTAHTVQPVADVVIARHALVELGLLRQTTTAANHSPQTPTSDNAHPPQMASKPYIDGYAFNGISYECLPYRQFVHHADSQSCELASHAIQLMRWREDNRFCSRCATPTDIHPKEYAACCPSCHYRSYPKVQPCIITAVTRIHPSGGQPQILLAQHHHHRDGMYGLIAGFMEIGESIESAVHREVLEEVGVYVHNLCYAHSQPWPFPTNLMIGFHAEYSSGIIKIQESELAHADFFDLDNLPKIPNTGTIARRLIDEVRQRYSPSYNFPKK